MGEVALSNQSPELPDDFMPRLSTGVLSILRAQSVTSSSWSGRLPYALTVECVV